MNTYMISLPRLLFWFIIILAIIFVFAIFNFFVFKYRKNKIIKVLRNFCDNKGYRMTIGKRTDYDFVLENGKKLYIKILFVPRYAAITVNSKDTWSLTYGGFSKLPGRGYPHQRYLDELKSFLRKDLSGIKIVLIYPTIDKVQKYLNESEIAILNYKESAHGIRFITFNNWESNFDDLI